MTSLWLNVVSNRPDNLGGPRQFWTLDFDDEGKALEDAKDYPRVQTTGGEVHYVETIEIKVGSGYDVIAQTEENWRALRTWLPKVPA